MFNFFKREKMKKEIPLFFGNPQDKSILTPEQYLRERKKRDLRIKFPKKAIFVSGDELEEIFKKKARIIYQAKFSGAKIWIIENKGKVIVISAKMGGSAVATQVEQLISKGVNKIIFVGSAGAINEKLNIGDIIIPSKAVRDEGLSFHYLKPSKFAYPNKNLLQSILLSAKNKKVEVKLGGTWTTDAFYRETFRKQQKYIKEGILTVEMEAAGLFAVGLNKGAKVASILVISDTHKKKWELGFQSKYYKSSLKKAFEIAIDVFKK